MAAEALAAAVFPAAVSAAEEEAAGNIKKMQRNVAKDCGVPFSYVKFIFVGVLFVVWKERCR